MGKHRSGVILQLFGAYAMILPILWIEEAEALTGGDSGVTQLMCGRIPISFCSAGVSRPSDHEDSKVGLNVSFFQPCGKQVTSHVEA